MFGTGHGGITASLYSTFLKRNFGMGLYGHLDETNPGGSDIVITTAGTYYGWTTAEAIQLSGGMTADFTGDADGFIVPKRGDYLVLGSVSFSGTANRTVECATFIDGVEDHSSFRRKLGAAGDVGAAPMIEMITVPSDNVKVDWRFTADVNSTTVTIEGMHVVLIRASR